MTRTRHPAPDRVFLLEVDGQEYESSDPTLTEAQIKAMAGIHNSFELYRITASGDELVMAQSVVDLRGPEMERLRASPRRVYKINVDGLRFESARSVVTGLDIKAMVGVTADFGLYLEGRVGADRPVSNDDTIDLSEPGTENFYTSPPATFGAG